MLRRTGVLASTLAAVLLLARSGTVHARHDRKASPVGRPTSANPNTNANGSVHAMTASNNETLFEAEPRPGAPVLRDPEILNRGEMVSLARKYAVDIAEALLEGEQHRAAAVRDKDAIKLACIQDRLSNMKTMKKLADERLAATDRPAVRADELRLRHEFRGVELSHTRVIELQHELLACVGESLQTTGGPPSDAPATPGDPANTTVVIPKMERPTGASPIK